MRSWHYTRRARIEEGALSNRRTGILAMVVGAVFIVISAVGFATSGGKDAAPESAASDAAAATTLQPSTSLLVSTTATSVSAPTSTIAPATTTTATTAAATTTTSPPSTTTTTTAAPETPEEFLALFVAALQQDAEFLVSRLNQATIDIYGAEQCLAAFSQVLDPETELKIREVAEPGSWDYVIDDLVTPIDAVLRVEVQRLVGGQTIIQELHWKLVEGLWTWFSDCGEPLAG